MYRGFKLPLLSFDDPSYYQTGLRLFNEQKAPIRSALKNFMYGSNFLDGSKIQSSWFPQVDADIFISHSHADEDIAVSLAGWLWDEFGLVSFIDSLVWGYSNELLKEIDNAYCLNEGGKNYDYDTRNYSTSHVHMMLCTALTMMIDRTECLFFLNTPSSVCPTENIEKTLSPWIYFEIATTKIVEPKLPSRDLLEARTFSEKFEKSLQITHELDLTHLSDLGAIVLRKWNSQMYSSSTGALDQLYRLIPPKKNKTTLH
jgi:hypothetical protein